MRELSSGLALRRAVGVAACGLLLLCACDTKNVGGPWHPPPPAIVQVTVPPNMQGGVDAAWTATWVGGWAPYTIEMNMGGGATANIAPGTPALSPFSHSFTMVNPSRTDAVTYTYTVTVTGSNDMRGTTTATYTVGPTPNLPPHINSAVYTVATRTLTVTASDPDDGEELYVRVTEVPGLSVDATGKYAAATGPYTAEFLWSAADLLAGGSGETAVSVTDSDGELVDTQTVMITVPPFPLAPDTLYAVPLVPSVAVGDQLRVMVVTGVPAHPLHYVNGVGLTIESDAAKVPESFNAGSIAAWDNPGWAGDVDGFWTAVNPAVGFLLPPDNFIIATDIGGGRERWDFNVTPVGGSEAAGASGALFSYAFTFNAAGTKTFGFQEFAGVKRTYYSDTANTEYFWGDISNSGAPTLEVN